MDVTCTAKYGIYRSLCLAQSAYLRLQSKTSSVTFVKHDMPGVEDTVYMCAAWTTGCIVRQLRPMRCFPVATRAPVESATYCRRSPLMAVVMTHWPLTSAFHHDFGCGHHHDIVQFLYGVTRRLCAADARQRAWAIANTTCAVRAQEAGVCELRTVTVVPSVDAACRFVSSSLGDKPANDALPFCIKFEFHIDGLTFYGRSSYAVKGRSSQVVMDIRKRMTILQQ